MDLSLVMQTLDDAQDYTRATRSIEAGTNSKAAAKHTSEVVRRRLAQLLLARFLLLHLLVEEARKLPGGLRQEHRRLWVLLQAQPRIFSTEFDIFTDLTRRLQGATTTDLMDRISRQCKALSGLRQVVSDPTTKERILAPFSCVLDEVQITVTERLGQFMSDDTPTKRPILREIWRSWTTLLQPGQMRLVLSGTGIDLQAVEISAGS